MCLLKRDGDFFVLELKRLRASLILYVMLTLLHRSYVDVDCFWERIDWPHINYYDQHDPISFWKIFLLCLTPLAGLLFSHRMLNDDELLDSIIITIIRATYAALFTCALYTNMLLASFIFQNQYRRMDNALNVWMTLFPGICFIAYLIF